MARGAKSSAELHALAEKRRRTDMREIRRELRSIRAALPKPVIHTFNVVVGAKRATERQGRLGMAGERGPEFIDISQFISPLPAPTTGPVLLGNRLGHRAW